MHLARHLVTSPMSSEDRIFNLPFLPILIYFFSMAFIISNISYISLAYLFIPTHTVNSREGQ